MKRILATLGAIALGISIGVGVDRMSTPAIAAQAYQGANVTNATGVLSPANGGTGKANNAAATLTRSGSHALTLTTSGTTGVTLPTSGTLYAVGGALGTPSSGTLTNASGLPISTGLTGAGTGVLTALGVNVGSAGAPVLFNGAGGTPSSIVLTNATGLPVSTGVSGLGSGVATFLATPSSANLLAALTTSTGTGSAVFSASPQFSGGVGIGLAGVAGVPLMIASNGGNNLNVRGRDNGGVDEGTIVFHAFNGSTYHGQILGQSGTLTLYGGTTPSITLNNNGTIKLDGVTPASTGTRYVCINTSGVISSSALACSGT